MATSYTSLLGFALPVTGELDGTWGDVVNNSITQLVEDSVAGQATASVTGGDWTLTTTGSGAANQARCAILIPTGTPGVSRNIIAPSSSKAYIVVNQSDAAVVLKGSATTGVTISAGTKVLCAWNGSDFVLVSGDLVGPSSATDNAVARFDGTTGKLVQNSAVTIADSTGDITGGKYNGLTVSTTTGTFTLTNAKTLSVTNTLTLSGTDSTTMTFPSTSQTIAGLGVAQTFTATNTFTQINYTNNAITASGNAATVPITHRLNTVTNNSAATLTITMTTASAVDGQMSVIRILDASAVAQTISWVNTENSTVSVPTTSNGSTTLPLTVGFMYNNATSKWRCVASA